MEPCGALKQSMFPHFIHAGFSYSNKNETVLMIKSRKHRHVVLQVIMWKSVNSQTPQVFDVNNSAIF